MDNICKEPFWNTTLTWDSEHPDFTNCFEQIVLECFPCAFLWLCIPFDAYILLTENNRLGRWTKLTIAKIALLLALIILKVMDFGFAAQALVHFDNSIPSVNVITSLVQILTFGLAILYIDLDRRKGIPSNAILFIFWLLLAVSGTLILRSKVLKVMGKEQSDPDDIFGLFTYEVYFPVIIAQLFLSAFADDYPERFEKWTKNPSPEQSASFLNRAFAHWITALLRMGMKRRLTKEDIWNLATEEEAEYLEGQLTKHWRKETSKYTLVHPVDITASQSMSEMEGIGMQTIRTRTEPQIVAIRSKKPSLVLALYKTIWPLFWRSAFLKIGYDGITIILPILLGRIIMFTARPDDWTWRGYVLAIFLFVFALIHTMCLGGMNFTTTRCGMRVRSALNAMIFRKSLVLSNSAKRQFAVGDVVNMLTADTQRISDFIYYHHYVWITPFTAVLMMYFLWQIVGIASLTGFFTLVAIVLINFVMIGRAKKFEISAVKQKDHRVRNISEIFGGIKILKLYAWETQYQKKIVDARENELRSLKKSGTLVTMNHALMLVSSPLAALTTYATYVYMYPGHVLTAKTAFVTLLFLFSLRHSLYLLPVGATLLVQGKIACGRLTEFFLAAELDPQAVEKLPMDHNFSAVTVVGGNFSWGQKGASKALSLRNINMEVKTGTIFAVVGAVGSGKSSILAALLGLMEKVSGQVTIRGKVAYVAQQAWNQNLTVRDNILFGKPYESEKYDKIIEACALRPDLEILTSGDETEIGEKGINLSGGQKLRISLARAVYADADIYLLDDPLSAVDAHVGKHIFERIIGRHGLLRGKTRILVTNAVNRLAECDIVGYLEQGRFSEVGSYAELVDRDERFGDFLRQCIVKLEKEGNVPADQVKKLLSPKQSLLDMDVEDAQEEQTSGTRSVRFPVAFEDSTPSTTEVGTPVIARTVQGYKERTEEGEKRTTIITAEVFHEGGPVWPLYKLMMREMSISISSGIFFGYLIANGFFLVSNMWVAHWCQANTTNGDGTISWPKMDYQVQVYATYALFQLIFAAIGQYCIAIGFVKAGRSLHNTMLARLMRAPMSYLDTIPMGRIVNRFSKDIDTIDSVIPMILRFVLNSFFQSLVFLLLVIYVFPLLTALIIPLGIAAYFIKGLYVGTTSQLKRLDVLSRSPLISGLQESMAGSNIIAAMEQGDRFVKENWKKLDHLASIIHCSNASLQWLTLVLMFMANVMTFVATIFAVYGRDNLGYSSKPAFVGLGLIGAIAFTMVFPWTTQNICDLEDALTSAERLKEYTKTPVEAPDIIANNRPPAKWPYFGNITFTDYQVRYREGLDFALDGLTCAINGGEKIGVVGRTGSGKSTLTLALLRLLEPAGGTIYVDGTDISRIGLHDLRSRITIIPQDPVLFSGSLRSNLDPFDESTDEQIWQALESSRLKQYFQVVPDGLSFVVTEGGSNLSVGQRQLVCLARALLRRSKILIMDEATAAIDYETDKFVQEVMRQEFAASTVITVAHRLNTIMDSTRVLVMDAGRIRQFDTPAKLLEDHHGLFYKLAKDAGAA